MIHPYLIACQAIIKKITIVFLKIIAKLHTTRYKTFQKFTNSGWLAASTSGHDLQMLGAGQAELSTPLM